MPLGNAPQIQLTHSCRPRGARTVVRLALAMLLLGFLWRITRFAVCFPLWGDEAFVATSLYNRGFADMLGPLEYDQTAPLGFMWAEACRFQDPGPLRMGTEDTSVCLWLVFPGTILALCSARPRQKVSPTSRGRIRCLVLHCQTLQ